MEATVLAAQNAEVLRALEAPEPSATVTEIARDLGRDSSNLSKTIAKLREAGLVNADVLSLTVDGEAMLPRLDVLEGRVTPPAGVLTLRHDQLKPSPLNPRRDFDSDEACEALDALRVSIVERGLQQNLLVRADADANGVRWIVAGERRWRAIGMAIEDGDLAQDFPILCRVKPLSDREHEAEALIENLLRRDLHPLEEAVAFRRLADLRGTREVAELAGRTQRHVQERMKLLELEDADQARMRLPKDDPGHLSVTGARELLQIHRETVASGSLDAPSTPPPALTQQVDVEDIAPRRVELTPAQRLILVEIDAAIRARPHKSPLGPSVRLGTSLDVTRAAHLDAQRLAAEGFISVTGSWPTIVTLLPAGRSWLDHAPGNFMTPEWKLQAARQDAGLDPAAVQKLVEDGDFATAWLNIAKPPPALTLTDDDALLLLEVYDHNARTKDDVQSCAGAPIRADFDRETVNRLMRENVLRGAERADWQDGLFRCRTTDVGQKALEAREIHLDNAGARTAALQKLRRALSVKVIVQDGKYVTAWLNGPFKPDPAWAERQGKQKAESERAEASRQALAAAKAKLHERFAELQAEIAALDVEAARAKLAEFLTSLAPAPWAPVEQRYDQDAVAADGRAIALGGSSAVARRVAIMAVNLLAGIAPADWPPMGGAVTRAAFEGSIVDTVMKAVAEGEPDVALTRERAVELAKGKLDAWLSDDGIVFGDDDYDWTADCADELASEILSDLEHREDA